MLLPLFEVSPGVMVRHPYQNEPARRRCWNYPGNCTRDQLLAYLAGCWRAGLPEIAARLLVKHRENGFFCQNVRDNCEDSAKTMPDPLFAHEQMTLRICAGDKYAQWDLLGQLMLHASIVSAKDAPPDTEINQLLIESTVCCRLDLFVSTIADWRERLGLYWKDYPAITEFLINTVELELERYSHQAPSDFFRLTLDLAKEVVELAKSLANDPTEWGKFDASKLQNSAKAVLIAQLNKAEHDARYLIGFGANHLKQAFQLRGGFPGPMGMFDVLPGVPSITAFVTNQLGGGAMSAPFRPISDLGVSLTSDVESAAGRFVDSAGDAVKNLLGI